MLNPRISFQIISDVHIENLSPKTIKDIITPNAPNLIIAGDLGRVEHFADYKAAIKEFCGMFQNVILVPGNHEYYSKFKWSIDYVNLKLKYLQDRIENLTVLLNETVTVNDVLIYGSIFWSKCPSNNVLPRELYVKDKDWGTIAISKEIFNKMHQDSINDLQRVIDIAKGNGKKLVVVTHYAPTFEGVISPKYATNGRKDLKNYMYCSDNDALLKDPTNLVWVYGHTGHNGRVDKLITNQVDKPGFMKDAVLTVK
jgi:predicted phosphohydrolase